MSSPELLSSVAREVEQFVATAGWAQAPQVFALLPTAQLLTQAPDLADQLDPASLLTPIAQEELTDKALEQELASILWPDTVAGVVLVREIVVLPPDVQSQSDNAEALAKLAEEHPQRRVARLTVGVLRDGTHTCLLHLQQTPIEPDELVEGPDFAPNLVTLLKSTLDPAIS
jgi:hypothetical protein